MKKALVLTNGRIAQVCAEAFEVHPDLTWADVPDDTTERDRYVDGTVVKEPPPDPAVEANAVRLAEIVNASKLDTTVTALKAMSLTEFNAWWAANVTNLSQANTVLKKLVQLMLPRL